MTYKPNRLEILTLTDPWSTIGVNVDVDRYFYMHNKFKQEANC